MCESNFLIGATSYLVWPVLFVIFFAKLIDSVPSDPIVSYTPFFDSFESVE